MNILAMDTSNQILGAALMKDGQLLGEHVTNMKKNHSVRLMPAIEGLMEEVGLAPDDLDKIVVSYGPGSYTGVRIGVTTAKTMAWALNIPVVGVSSLEVLAYQGRLSGSLVCSFFDARRGLVYAGVYQWQDNRMMSVRPDANLLMDDLLNELKQNNQPVVFLSPDLHLHRERIEETMGEQAIIPESPYHFPNPAHLAFAGSMKEADDLHTLSPQYLRLAEAEANWMKMQKDLSENG